MSQVTTAIRKENSRKWINNKFQYFADGEPATKKEYLAFQVRLIEERYRTIIGWI